ncbi:MAG TPA: ferrous iron transport protein B [Myxococcota bacterium]|nr:ferrous iron transport protein B [Myxococcota bacterium]HQK50917.1 ferrous iron transport protein B [Myxococcota bacterium]
MRNDRSDRLGVRSVALVGQPNCGKSTLFNALAGFKANTGNFPGTSIRYTRSLVSVGGQSLEVVDLPGTYSLTPRDAAEEVTRRFLEQGRADAVIAVLDASVLSRSLELLLEVLEMGLPTVVALNMMDEAARKGVEVDPAALEALLGVPVVPTVATRGKGVVAVILKALGQTMRPGSGRPPTYDRDVEESLGRLAAEVPPGLAESVGRTPRSLAIRLLEGDFWEVQRLGGHPESAGLLEAAARERRLLAEMHGWPEDTVFGSHRHAMAVDLFEKVATVRPRRRRSRRERLDDWIMHPVLGLLLAVGVFAGLFGVSFYFGNFLSEVVAGPFDRIVEAAVPGADRGLSASLIRGFLQGVSGGVGIVLPYLLPLLLILSLLEDVGYLPRAAFLVDGLLHRVGLHGKSVIPLILGYGCNVPGIYGTRILESHRDRVLTALLVPLTACSARTVVILALVGATMGPWWALGVYGINILVTALAARGMSALAPGQVTGLLMDIPPYRLPPLGAVAKKVWFRVREFLVQAWPILVAASMVLGLLEWMGVEQGVNRVLAPVTTGLLGLPEAVGVTLFFGILRKELALVMTFQALGTQHPAEVMTPVQLLTFTLFLTFYVPCVSTLAAQVREVGPRWTTVGVLLSTGIALAVAAATRLVGLWVA